MEVNWTSWAIGDFTTDHYFKYESEIKATYDVIALMDSDRSRTGELHGVTFHNIDEIGQISFDVIVVAPAYHKMEIIHQLMAHGITKDKIIPWLPFVCSATPETTIRIEDDSC